MVSGGIYATFYSVLDVPLQSRFDTTVNFDLAAEALSPDPSLRWAVGVLSNR